MSDHVSFEELFEKFPHDNLEVHLSEEQANISTKLLSEKYGFNYPSTFTHLSALAYPYLNVNMLTCANNWQMWLWNFDDIVDKGQGLSASETEAVVDCLAVLNGQPPKSKISQLLDDIISNIDHQIKTYIVEKAKEYIINGVIAHHQLTSCPSIEKYLEIRFADGGCETVFALICLDNPSLINTLASTQMIEARRLVNSIICKTNDLYSYNKDIFRDKTFFNYVYIVQNNGSLSTAVNKVIGEIQDEYQKLLNYPVTNEHEQTLIDRMIIWCKANFIWHYRSYRYRQY